jgi:hypothetical protein
VAELTNNHKNLLRASIIGGVLLSGLFGWLGYEDYKAREAGLETIAQKRGELDRAEAQIREIPRLEEKIIVLRETVNQYVRILPEEKDINTFVDQLTQFATRSNVRVRKLDDEDARARSGRNKKGATAAFDRIVYKVSLEGNCAELLKFMDLFENHERFVRIASFKIEHRESSDKDVDQMTVPHQVDLDLETYVYNPKVKSKENVDIPQEAQKLERLKTAGLVGGDAVPELALTTYTHDASLDRRDLFYDPRLLGAMKQRETEEQRKLQRQTLEDLVGRLQRLAADLVEEGKIENTVRKLQAREKNNRELVAFGAEMGKANFTVEEVKERFEREVQMPFRKMLEGRGDLSMEAAPVLAVQIEEHVGKMRAAYEDSRWEEVVNLNDELTRMAAAAASGADIKAMLKESATMHRTAKAHLDFNARPISFGGAVCFENDPAHAVVIINGRSYAPGESVDQDLVVRSISPASITFEFRGVVLTQPMKSSAPRPTAPNEKRAAPKAGPNAKRNKS